MAFITVYSKTTGQRQRIPEDWWGHPVLGRDFRKTPPPSEAEGSKTRGSATAGSGSHSTANHKEKK